MLGLALVGLLSLGPVLVFAHEENTSTFECHEIDEEDEDRDECHCHVPGEVPITSSCETELPAMEILLELERVNEELYFGLRIEPENECTDYKASLYPYGSTLDVIKSDELGGIYGAYEDECFDAYTDVDIEHLVARKEAHDSGLCAADAQVRINFANDLENIVLASPSVNRSKSAHDPADWLPDHNDCWYVWQHLHIKRKYDMSIDEAEKNAIGEVLQNCSIEDLNLELDESCTFPDTSEFLQEVLSEPG